MVIFRFLVLGVVCIVFFILMDRNVSIFSIVSYVWVGFGVSFGFVILFLFFWLRMMCIGVIVGMFFGVSMVILYDKFGKSFLDIYEIVLGFIVVSIVIVVFSLFFSVWVGIKEVFEIMFKEIESLRY